MAAPEARQAECRRRATDQPADVAADRDVRDREGEDEVDHDDPESAPAEDVVTLPLEHEPRPEDAEDRARGADGRSRGVEDERARGARESRDEVEHQVATRA